MIEQPGRGRSRRRVGADHDGGNVARLVGGVGGAVLAEGEAGEGSLVPGHEHRRGAALVGGTAQDLRQLVLQPGVAVLDGDGVRAVVHVVHRVRGDERKGWQRVVVEVGLELRVGDVEHGAPREAREVWCRVVPNGVADDTHRPAVGRHRFHVGLPRGDLREQAVRVAAAGRARAAVEEELLHAAQREARGRTDVVGQAHVRDVVEVRGQTTAGDEHVIDVGGGG